MEEIRKYLYIVYIYDSLGNQDAILTTTNKDYAEKIKNLLNDILGNKKLKQWSLISYIAADDNDDLTWWYDENMSNKLKNKIREKLREE